MSGFCRSGHIYISLCKGRTHKKAEGSTGSNGDCSKLPCQELPILAFTNTYHPEYYFTIVTKKTA